MKVRIVTLSENTASPVPRLLAEHGLSIYLEAEDYRLIFDTGQTMTATHNAGVLEIDLKGLPIAISHGHFDHTGGLCSILDLTGPAMVFGHTGIFERRYALHQGKLLDAGIPFTRSHLEGLGAKFDLSTEPRQISDRIWLTGAIPRTTDFETPEPDLLIMDPERKVDPIIDDQALVVELDRGLLVVLGCAHSGLINTIEWAREITGQDRIAGIIGGTHLGFGDKKRPEGLRVQKTVEALKAMDFGMIGVSHCTGLEVGARLSAEFGDRFIFNRAGTVLEF
ncbi:MAG TPA: MBL fold metallo-hydrolase [Methanotrichaceae archaeon]|nr:MBL fold metallo-hydrolase [Methanotrichaceae archaeon]